MSKTKEGKKGLFARQWEKIEKAPIFDKEPDSKDIMVAIFETPEEAGKFMHNIRAKYGPKKVQSKNGFMIRASRDKSNMKRVSFWKDSNINTSFRKTTKKATAKKSETKKATVKKTASKPKATKAPVKAKKSASKKATAKKSPAKKATAKKSASKPKVTKEASPVTAQAQEPVAAQETIPAETNQPDVKPEAITS